MVVVKTTPLPIRPCCRMHVFKVQYTLTHIFYNLPQPLFLSGIMPRRHPADEWMPGVGITARLLIDLFLIRSCPESSPMRKNCFLIDRFTIFAIFFPFFIAFDFLHFGSHLSETSKNKYWSRFSQIEYSHWVMVKFQLLNGILENG